jgi:hypothetical protein
MIAIVHAFPIVVDHSLSKTNRHLWSSSWSFTSDRQCINVYDRLSVCQFVPPPKSRYFRQHFCSCFSLHPSSAFRDEIFVAWDIIIFVKHSMNVWESTLLWSQSPYQHSISNYTFKFCHSVEIALRSGRIVGFRGLTSSLKQLKAIVDWSYSIEIISLSSARSDSHDRFGFNSMNFCCLSHLSITITLMTIITIGTVTVWSFPRNPQSLLRKWGIVSEWRTLRENFQSC